MNFFSKFACSALNWTISVIHTDHCGWTTLTPLRGVKRWLFLWSCCELSPTNFTATWTNYLNFTVQCRQVKSFGFCCNSWLILCMWGHWTVNALFFLQHLTDQYMIKKCCQFCFCHNCVTLCSMKTVQFCNKLWNLNASRNFLIRMVQL